MKTKLLPVLFLAVFITATIDSKSQANKSLSNLTAPTAVNQHLLPNANNTKDLGHKDTAWRDLYLSGRLYINGYPTIYSPDTSSFFTGIYTKDTNTGSNNARIAGLPSLTQHANTAFGTNALNRLFYGSYPIGDHTKYPNNNTATGFEALFNNWGDNNMANGYQALYSNVLGHNNTASGFGSLYSNIKGNNNTASGYCALFSNDSGSYNTANGFNALYYNDTGSYNTASGGYALYLNKSGSYNTATGYNAMYSNTAGNCNTANGYGALHLNKTGYSNTATGCRALYNNITGYHNTATGDSSLLTNTIGYNNTATGVHALAFNTTGFSNTANGFSALYLNTEGNYNTATGANALKSNTTATANTAIGYKALHSSSNGYSNTASGAFALLFNTEGYGNTATGDSSLFNNTTASFSTATGSQALFSNQTGTANTAVGSRSLYSNVSGTYNTAIGYKADVKTSELTNATAIGNGTVVSASNQVRIGNAAVTSIGGNASWTTISDGRFKKNIKDNIPGLSFIKMLKPVTYSLDVTALHTFLNKEIKNNNASEKRMQEEALTTAEREAIQKKEKIIYSGFVAQDVEKAARQIGYNFSGIDAPDDKDGLYGLRYSDFVAPLVMAVQELDKRTSEENKKLKEEVAELEARLSKLEAFVAGNGVNTSTAVSNSSAAYLEQSVPNPSNTSTNIRYYVPAYASTAKIVVMDMRGVIVNSIPLSDKGKGQISIHTGNLVAGSYSYILYVDGKRLDAKSMVVTR